MYLTVQQLLELPDDTILRLRCGGAFVAVDIQSQMIVQRTDADGTSDDVLFAKRTRLTKTGIRVVGLRSLYSKTHLLLWGMPWNWRLCVWKTNQNFAKWESFKFVGQHYSSTEIRLWSVSAERYVKAMTSHFATTKRMTSATKFSIEAVGPNRLPLTPTPRTFVPQSPVTLSSPRALQSPNDADSDSDTEKGPHSVPVTPRSGEVEPQPEVLCQECERNPCTVFCVVDKARLCQRCDRKLHSLGRVLSQHERIEFARAREQGMLASTYPRTKPLGSPSRLPDADERRSLTESAAMRNLAALNNSRTPRTTMKVNAALSYSPKIEPTVDPSPTPIPVVEMEEQDASDSDADAPEPPQTPRALVQDSSTARRANTAATSPVTSEAASPLSPDTPGLAARTNGTAEAHPKQKVPIPLLPLPSVGHPPAANSPPRSVLRLPVDNSGALSRISITCSKAVYSNGHTTTTDYTRERELKFRLPEGVDQNESLEFYVHEPVKNLRRVGSTYKMGMRVHTETLSMGDFAPRATPYVFPLPEKKIPEGWLVRNSYTATVEYIDDYGACFPQVTYTFEIVKQSEFKHR
eukprot:TRINITY_DN8640_c0_g2_i1.p1 TRINITY_DN8640_c0_g2~~TRINITY_DN8640_c0_g2_i1.p1  ORF type:complete len:578 (-),score=104.74 TRINITY_DN8640_c0_g2_i1:375-2108(-)